MRVVERAPFVLAAVLLACCSGAACQGDEPLVPDRTTTIQPEPDPDIVDEDSPVTDPRVDPPDGYERTVSLYAWVLDANTRNPGAPPHVHVLDLSEGRWLYSFDAPDTAKSIAHDLDESLFVLSDDGLHTFDARTGAALTVDTVIAANDNLADDRVAAEHVAVRDGEPVIAAGRELLFADGGTAQTDEDVLELFAFNGELMYVAGAYRDLHAEIDPSNCCAPAWVETFHVVTRDADDTETRAIEQWDADVEGVGYRAATGSDGLVAVSVHGWNGDESPDLEEQSLWLTEVWNIDYELDATSYTQLDSGVFAAFDLPSTWQVVDVTAARVVE